MRSLPILPSIDGVPDTRRVQMAAPLVTSHTSRPSATSLQRRTRLAVGAVGITAAFMVVVTPAAFGQGAPPQETTPAYNGIVQAPPTLPNPVQPPAPATAAPSTANVAGIQITTTPTTVAITTATTVAPVVSVAPQASVLGSVEEQAEDVAFTGSESGRFTALGVAFTAVGAALIAVTRRRRRA
jgi:hypothetical protein